MQKIKSFEIDHTVLVPGFYISRKDGDITTYDLRTKKPNSNDVMNNVTMHTTEHMFATYIRNSAIANDVIYFGPMGCQTGFYLLVRNADDDTVFETTKQVLKLIIEHTGEVFGCSQIECGNYKTLDLKYAKAECEQYLKVLENINKGDYYYGEQK